MFLKKYIYWTNNGYYSTRWKKWIVIFFSFEFRNEFSFYALILFIFTHFELDSGLAVQVLPYWTATYQNNPFYMRKYCDWFKDMETLQ